MLVLLIGYQPATIAMGLMHNHWERVRKYCALLHNQLAHMLSDCVLPTAMLWGSTQLIVYQQFRKYCGLIPN